MLAVGYGPFSGAVAARIVEAFGARASRAECASRGGGHSGLAPAGRRGRARGGVVMESPGGRAAARRPRGHAEGRAAVGGVARVARYAAEGRSRSARSERSRCCSHGSRRDRCSTRGCERVPCSRVRARPDDGERERALGSTLAPVASGEAVAVIVGEWARSRCTDSLRCRSTRRLTFRPTSSRAGHRPRTLKRWFGRLCEYATPKAG